MPAMVHPFPLLALLGCLHPAARAPDAGSLPTASPADVVAVVTLPGGTYLAGGPGGGVPSGDWTRSGSGPDDWEAPTVDVDATRPVGSQWRVGGGLCEVVGYGLVAREYVDGYYDDQGSSLAEPVAPSCASPEILARVRCDDQVSGDLAIPAGFRAPDVATLRPARGDTADAAAIASVRALPAWIALGNDVADEAAGRGVTVGEELTATEWQADSGTWWVVDASAWSGEGQDYCGGEDVFRRGLVVTDATGTTVLLQRWIDDRAELTGVLDVDHDGIPELRTAPWFHDQLLWGEDQSSDLQTVSSCVCGC